MLELEQAGFDWPDGSRQLQDISLTLAAGECAALVGANGAGKSTLLRLACGLLRPGSGRVRLAGVDTREARPPALARLAGLMFQEPERQICHARVDLEVGFAPRLAGRTAADIRHRVDEALALTGLEAMARAHPLDLDAGARRMVTLASLIAQAPGLLLLDEPTRDLDAVWLARFERWLEHARHQGQAVLMISHDLDFVARHASRVLHLAEHRLVADGPPERVLADPRLQSLDGLPAPTLPALGRGLGMQPVSQPEAFAAQWDASWQDRQNGRTA